MGAGGSQERKTAGKYGRESWGAFVGVRREIDGPIAVLDFVAPYGHPEPMAQDDKTVRNEQERKARQAAALRENLARRKAQSRGRREEAQHRTVEDAKELGDP